MTEPEVNVADFQDAIRQSGKWEEPEKWTKEELDEYFEQQ